ncbi:AAA family ATPase [Candidatus Woesearchaeota archaeon]|nr:AAA family ATPase [Candidatus Woesearchaeota archaeon]
MNTVKYELKPEQLRKKADVSFLDFTAANYSLESIIGQEKAESALDFGLNIESPGYNVFATGEHGLGKKTTIEKLANKYAKGKEVPCDQVVVKNYNDADTPLVLELKPGTAKEFKKDVEDVEGFIVKVYDEVKKTHRELLKDKIEKPEKAARKKFEGILKKYEIEPVYRRDDNGFILDVHAKLLNADGLDQNQQKLILSQRMEEQEVQDAMQGFAFEMGSLLHKLSPEIKRLEESEKKLKPIVIEQYVKDLCCKYGNEEFFKEVEKALKSDIDNLGKKKVHMGQELPNLPFGLSVPVVVHEEDKRYEVNIAVDNSGLEGAPVIFEDDPSIDNLVGRIDRWNFNQKKPRHMGVKAGSLMKANGGYLIIDAWDLIKNIKSWDKLCQALKNNEIAVDDGSGIFSPGVKTTPFKTDVKVILTGEYWLRWLMQEHLPEFNDLFKVHAEFVDEMRYKTDSVKQYAEFVNNLSYNEKLLKVSPAGIAAIVEDSLRKCASKKKLSTNFGYVADLVREANYWAKKRKVDEIDSLDIDKAVEARKERSNNFEDRVREFVEEGIYNIPIQGREVGQVNGLAVYEIDYMFGNPTRITAVTSVGDGGVVNVEEEAKLGGKIYNKSVQILKGRLKKKFAQEKSLSLDASLCFEQSYGGVDGDSATLASLCALYSSLSDIGINQSIAITGSADQFGKAQAIGGVNAKIEGWYETCKRRGLTGWQGVIIPKSNLDDLMLSNEVVDAVKQGKFHVYAVSSDEEAAEILMGTSIEKIDEKIKEKLEKFSDNDNVVEFDLEEEDSEEDEVEVLD